MDSAKYNHLTHTYDLQDGTHVGAELIDSVECLADVLFISNIRESQRETQKSRTK